MTESFRIPYPKNPAQKKLWNKRFGLNSYWSGKPWQLRKQDADYWHLLVRSEMDKQGVRKRPFEKPVKIKMCFNDRLDCSNHAIFFKMIEDSVKGRIIQDDSRRYVKSCEMCFHEEDYILVKITEI